MSDSFTLASFLAQTDGLTRGVLAVLAAASVATWSLIVVRSIQSWRSRAMSQRFLDAFWAAPNLEAVASQLRDHGTPEPFSHLVHHGFTAVEQLQRQDGARTLVNAGAPQDMLTRALRRAIEEDQDRLGAGQTLLATVASSAPFVGLLGTVWGIYHALAAISATGQSTLDKVAGPVGEALIMTGIGLAVAIPAAVAYNVFARMQRHTFSRLNAFAYDVFNLLATGATVSPRQVDARHSGDKIVALARAQHPASI
jgi:biopolymer transport protein ExbB